MALFRLFSQGLALQCRTFVCLFPALLGAQDLLFSPGPPIAIGETLPKAFPVAVADVTNDGKPDILIGTSSGLVLLAGAGDAQFEPGRRILSECGVMSLAVGDSDGDAAPDIAALCPDSSFVVILKHVGDGDFRELSRLSVSSSEARGMAAADINQDGRLDLVVAQFNGLALFAGNGDGTFAPVGELTVDGEPVAVLASDFNADGIVDLAVAKATSSVVSMFLGSGAARFQTPIQLDAGNSGYGRDLAVADLNGDGSLDLAAACDEGMVVWFGAGDGSFSVGTLIGTSDMPVSVAIADLNGDGSKDVVLGNYYNGEISILTGSGDGTFARTSMVAAVGDVFAVVLADINGDSKPDLTATSYSGSSALVALGRGDGAFDFPTYFGFTNSSFLRGSDLDSDGKTELAAFVVGRKSAFFLQGGSAPIGAMAWSDYPLDAQFGDFNRDGRPDLVVATLRTLTGKLGDDLELNVLFLAGRGGELFDQPVKVASQSYLMTSQDYLTWMGTGSPLLVSCDFTGISTPGFVLANNATKVLHIFSGKGDGAFEPVAQVNGIEASAMVPADFDRDGIGDVAVAVRGVAENPGTVIVFFGGRDGKYPDPKSLTSCNAPQFLLQGDFNGDSKVDLAVVCASEITLLINTGDGVFRVTPSVKMSVITGRITAASVSDFDKDGKDDVSVAYDIDDTSGGGAILRGKNDGTLEPAVEVRLPAAPVALLAQDWDGDGRPDIAVLNGLDATVTIMGSQVSPEPTRTLKSPRRLSWPWRSVEVK